MVIAKIIRCNLALVLLVGLYGILTDEPYWRDVGHGPCLYDYLFWSALAFNGPSGFAADYLSEFGSRSAESRFVIQYGWWCALLWSQWKLYHLLALWCRESRARQMMLYSIASLVIVAGGAGACAAWSIGHRPSEFFIDQYFWFVRVGGAACSGLVLLFVYAVTRRAYHPNIACENER
jgi:hypothetical protein